MNLPKFIQVPERESTVLTLHVLKLNIKRTLINIVVKRIKTWIKLHQMTFFVIIKYKQGKMCKIQWYKNEQYTQVLEHFKQPGFNGKFQKKLICVPFSLVYPSQHVVGCSSNPYLSSGSRQCMRFQYFGLQNCSHNRL